MNFRAYQKTNIRTGTALLDGVRTVDLSVQCHWTVTGRAVKTEPDQATGQTPEVHDFVQVYYVCARVRITVRCRAVNGTTRCLPDGRVEKAITTSSNNI